MDVCQKFLEKRLFFYPFFKSTMYVRSIDFNIVTTLLLLHILKLGVLFEINKFCSCKCFEKYIDFEQSKNSWSNQKAAKYKRLPFCYYSVHENCVTRVWNLEEYLQDQQICSLADLSKTPKFLSKLNYLRLGRNAEKRSSRLFRNRLNLAKNLKAQISLILAVLLNIKSHYQNLGN